MRRISPWQDISISKGGSAREKLVTGNLVAGEIPIRVDSLSLDVPKWKKGETEFTVGVNYHPKRGAQCAIPKPVVGALGEPDKITFSIKGKKVEVKAARPSG